MLWAMVGELGSGWGEPRALSGLWAPASPHSPSPPGRAVPDLPVPRWQRHSHRHLLDVSSFPADVLETVEGDGRHSPRTSPAAQAACKDGCVSAGAGGEGLGRWELCRGRVGVSESVTTGVSLPGSLQPPLWQV